MGGGRREFSTEDLLQWLVGVIKTCEEEGEGGGC